jgi:molybdate transport system substrate-binding protein
MKASSSALKMLAFGLVAVLLFTCCGRSQKPESPESPELTVAAAADLEKVFAEIGKDFESETSAHVTFSFAASGTLKQQIENGAPFDVFASANVAYVTALMNEQLIVPDRQRIYAVGHITLWQRKDSKVQVNSLADLTKPGVNHIAIANPGHAPYGAAAVEALLSAGIYDQVKPKLVLGENVLEALQFAESGNADVALVPLSLSGDRPDGRLVQIDPALYKPIQQAVCVIKSTHHGKLAGQFVDFLEKPKAIEALKRYGFTVPAKEPDTRD